MHSNPHLNPEILEDVVPCVLSVLLLLRSFTHGQEGKHSVYFLPVFILLIPLIKLPNMNPHQSCVDPAEDESAVLTRAMQTFTARKSYIYEKAAHAAPISKPECIRRASTAT